MFGGIGCPRLPCEIEFVFFHARLADLLTLSFQECVSHRPADEKGVHLAHQILDDGDLVAHFGSAQNGDERLFRMLQGFTQIAKFLFHQQPGGGLLHKLRNANRGRVRPMRGAEGIVHIDLAQLGELL